MSLHMARHDSPWDMWRIWGNKFFLISVENLCWHIEMVIFPLWKIISKYLKSCCFINISNQLNLTWLFLVTKNVCIYIIFTLNISDFITVHIYAYVFFVYIFSIYPSNSIPNYLIWKNVKSSCLITSTSHHFKAVQW